MKQSEINNMCCPEPKPKIHIEFNIGDELIQKETRTTAKVVSENKFNKTYIIYDNSDKRNHEIPKDWAHDTFSKKEK